MDRKELEKANEWAKKQSKEVKIDLPEREPDEPPPTQTQIRYVKSMSKDMDEEEIRKLGTKQVASLIEQLKLEQEMFTDELVAKTAERQQQSGCLSTILLGVILGVLVYICL
jgi:flagellum-specific peptidoglycan hydrolase FlgJ